MQDILLKLKNIHKRYSGVEVLRGISMVVERGETLAITGKSGEGKSTLLQIIGTLEKPCEGHLEICGIIPTDGSLHKLRNQHMGFIFQTYNLLDEYTVLENLLMPQKIARKDVSRNSPARLRALALLDEVQLTSKADILTKFLSGGEKQRVAIARALCNNPDIILADEPTGNLDGENSTVIQKLLIRCAKEHQKTLIIATHDLEFASLCDRILSLKDGLFYTAI